MPHKDGGKAHTKNVTRQLPRPHSPSEWLAVHRCMLAAFLQLVLSGLSQGPLARPPKVGRRHMQLSRRGGGRVHGICGVLVPRYLEGSSNILSKVGRTVRTRGVTVTWLVTPRACARLWARGRVPRKCVPKWRPPVGRARSGAHHVICLVPWTDLT